MSSSTCPSSAAWILLSAVILLSSTATTSAFNITRILERYPDFGEFNSLLTKVGLVGEINSRRTITVLALSNDRIGEIAGKPEDLLKRILSTHVVLDYYDLLKLNKLKDTKTVLTTLYQASGIADDQQGFLDVVHKKDGSIVFGSAMPGAPHDIQLLGTVASQPYNISVLSISRPIIAPGIDGTYQPVSAPPPKVVTPPPTSEVPPPAETPEEETAADEPTADAPQPSEAPADAPVADAPSADAPSADAPSADADDSQTIPPPSNSASKKHVISGVSLALAVALVFFQAAH